MTLEAGLPIAGRTVISLAPEHYERIRRTVRAAFRLAHGASWQARVDAGAPEALRFSPGNFGVFMGYDFHLGPGGPRLIEINTNAGGALVNGLHTASLCDPTKLACLCADLLPVETVEERLVAQFVAEYEAVHGAGARPRRIAIADERPERQFLRAEFALMRELFERRGFEAHVCDTAELLADAEGGVALRGAPVDLRIETPEREMNVRAEGEAIDVEAFRSLVVAYREKTPIRLRDVAVVEDGLEDRRRVGLSMGEPSIGFGITKLRGGNAVQVGREVKAKMALLQAQLPEGLSLGINWDTTIFVEQAIHEILFTLILAALLTGAVCWVFLGSWSTTLNVLLAIHTSILGTFVVIYIFGFTLNTFTVLGLTGSPKPPSRPSSRPGRTAPSRTPDRATGGWSRGTWWCWTSAGCWTDTAWTLPGWLRSAGWEQRPKRCIRRVRSAHGAALGSIRAGVPARSVDAAARQVLEDKGLGAAFVHGTGHGLGLEVHEAPRVSRLSPPEEVLEAGMVCTVEPGAYVPGLGGARLEDDVVVTDKGAELLTTPSRDLLVSYL